jgi:hypothetical protein
MAASEQVALRNPSGSITGWTLNVSRGGARLIVEEPVIVGQTWDMLAGETETPRPVRVVWIHNEAGGQIVGVQYLDTVGTIPPYDGFPETT